MGNYQDSVCNVCLARVREFFDDIPPKWRLVLVHRKDGSHEAIWVRKVPVTDA